MQDTPSDIEKLRFPVGRYVVPEEITPEIRGEWSQIIAETPTQLRERIQGLDETALNWRYRPNGWNIRQVVHHFADSHANAIIRMKLTLTEDNPTIKPYNEALWAELADTLKGDLNDSLNSVEGIHNRWSVLLAAIKEAEWGRTFYHPEYDRTYTLEESLGNYAWHCEHHLAHIDQAIKLRFD